MSARGRTPTPSLSPARRRLFGVLTVLLPFVLLGAFELILRLANYGPDLRLFHKETIRGVEYLLLNPDVKGRYFGTVPFSPSSSPDYFRAQKDPGTYRVFFLGGSTTVGYPYWYNGSFSSFLRQRLRAAFSDRRIEVVNIGMTATNSYTALDMAREVMEYEPDLLIVYDGHNEFYGAMGISSAESLGGSHFITTLSLRLMRFRTYVLLRSTMASVHGWFSSAPVERSQTTLMEQLARGQYIPYGSPTYWRAYESFRANMQGLVDLCRDHHVPVILSTQVSNLRDQAPFINGHLPTTSANAMLLIDSLLSAGQTALDRHQPTQAEAAARQARSVDTTFAKSSFLLGQALAAQRRFAEARTAFVAARDFDQLRFRMSTDFNQLVLSFDAPPAVFAADIERAFRDASPDSLIGHELITEHLHPHARGFFIASNVYARVMRTNGLAASPDDWRKRDTLTEAQLWDMRPVTELDELVAKRRTEVLTAGWPFKEGFPIVDAMPKDTLSQIAEQTTRSYLDWKSAHEAAADYYQRRGELKKAEREHRAIIDQIPLDITGYLSLAKLLLAENDLRAMAQVLRASLAIEQTIQAYRTLGDIAMHDRDPRTAITYYEGMRIFAQTREEQAKNDLVLARAYLDAGQGPRAKELTLQILAKFPSFQQAVDLLLEISKRGV